MSTVFLPNLSNLGVGSSLTVGSLSLDPLTLTSTTSNSLFTDTLLRTTTPGFAGQGTVTSQSPLVLNLIPQLDPEWEEFQEWKRLKQEIPSPLDGDPQRQISFED